MTHRPRGLHCRNKVGKKKKILVKVNANWKLTGCQDSKLRIGVWGGGGGVGRKKMSLN